MWLFKQVSELKKKYSHIEKDKFTSIIQLEVNKKRGAHENMINTTRNEASMDPIVIIAVSVVYRTSKRRLAEKSVPGLNVII